MFDTNLWETVQAWLAEYGLRVLGAILVLIVGRLVIGWLTKWVRGALQRSSLDETLTNFTASLLYYALLVMVVVAALNLVGFETTSIIAVLGAATLAIGLALQDSLGNFAAGVMIILFRPYQVGHLVELAGAFGRVTEVRIFNTILTTLDSAQIIVPNGSILKEKIINYSINGVRRIDMVFGIGYDDDLLKAKGILEELLGDHELILTDPPPEVSVLELGDSSVNFAVRPYVEPDNYWPVYFFVHEQVKLRFDEQGISIPFPQRDVHLFPTGS